MSKQTLVAVHVKHASKRNVTYMVVISLCLEAVNNYVSTLQWHMSVSIRFAANHQVSGDPHIVGLLG